MCSGKYLGLRDSSKDDDFIDTKYYYVSKKRGDEVKLIVTKRLRQMPLFLLSRNENLQSLLKVPEALFQRHLQVLAVPNKVVGSFHARATAWHDNEQKRGKNRKEANITKEGILSFLLSFLPFPSFCFFWLYFVISSVRVVICC